MGASVDSSLVQGLELRPTNTEDGSTENDMVATSNRLKNARSLYLLQHAHNPVDWYEWCDEAFEKAQRENKPVFLSIGYSACHWCHVMEQESFVDEATASVLNEHFVSIKVDREERPDIDQIYQLAHQVLTGRAGGWPLSVFLTPDKRPFYAGTYFPNVRKYGMPSFQDVLFAVREAWRERRNEIVHRATELTQLLGRIATLPMADSGAIDETALEDAVRGALRRADRHWGGFGRAPKFPHTMTLELLLVAAARRGDTEARTHALRTLDRMDKGGIHDHLGGGFARYSTDERWQIPHFEKMLYDNAQLARLYLDGWRLLSDGEPGDISRERCRAVVSETLTYVLREMTDPSGIFYSAQDADSDGEEGKFYVWTREEIRAALPHDDAEIVCAYFDVTPEGNFEQGKSVLWIPYTIEKVAETLGRETREIEQAITRSKPLLFAAREKRVKPTRDDKCLASWNGLMIAAMADAGATLAEPRWIEAAERALDVWKTTAWKNGRLFHAIKNGEAYGTGFLDDYASLACAALDVYEASFVSRHLMFARELCNAMLSLFWDDGEGGFFYTPRDGEVVLHRTKEIHDHAYPSGTGLAVYALLRLSNLIGEPGFARIAERVAANLAGAARKDPMGMASMMRAVDRVAQGSVEIVVVGDPSRADTRAMLHAVRSVYIPHRTMVCVRDEQDAQQQGLDPALVAGRKAGMAGAPMAYVCRRGVCSPPIERSDALVRLLRDAVTRP